MNHATVSALIIVLNVTAVAPSEDQPRSALEILNRVDRAAKAVRAVEYDFIFDAEGDDFGLVPRITGTFAMRGWAGRMPAEFRVDVEVTKPRDAAPARYTAGRVGGLYYLVDHYNRKVHVGADTDVMGAAEGVVLAGMMSEFVHPDPFSDEIEGSATLLGEKSVAREPCDEIHITYFGILGLEAAWCFSQTDHLPRRRIDPADLPNGKRVRMRKTITRLVVDPDWPGVHFAIDVPPGYDRVTTPAP